MFLTDDCECRFHSQALFSAHAEDSAFRKGFLECKQIFIENAKIAHFSENFSVWKHCFVQTNRE